MKFRNISGDELSKFKDERVLFPLSRNSNLLDFLRAMYSLMLDYGVYLGDGDAEPLIFSKDQLVALIERGNTEVLLRDLPELALRDEIHAIRLDEFVKPDEIHALIIERRGVSVGTLLGAFSPDTPDYPAWWTAPIPFAMCGRSKIRLNPAAISEFGADLERMNVSELPEKDEFIVELDGREKPFFLSFSRLAAGIFAIEDCTGDLVEAQDISWWAGLGRLWVDLITAGGRKWRRLEDLNNLEGKYKINKNVWPCEWQGRFMGYFCIDDDKNVDDKINEENSKIDEEKINKIEKDDKIEKIDKNEKNEKNEKNVDESSIDGDKIIVDDTESKAEKADNGIKEEFKEELKDEMKEDVKEELENTEFIKDKENKEIEDNGNNGKPEKRAVKKGENVKKSVKKGVKKDVKKDIKKGIKNDLEKDLEKDLGLENDDKNDILRAISPQTLGLLAPGLNYNYYEQVEPEHVPVKRRIKGDLRL